MKIQNMDIYTMTDNKNFLIRKKSIIVYSLSLAFLLFLLKWLELRFIIFNHSFEIYIGFIAIIFTALGIWLALRLSKPKHDSYRVETVVVEKEVYVYRNENLPDSPIFAAGRQYDFVPDTSLVTQLELSKRELEILSLLAQGHSNQEIAEILFISLSTVKTHNQNLFEKLDVKRRIQAVEKAKRLNLIP
jgi:two-component system, NarL family, response regulator LiaR